MAKADRGAAIPQDWNGQDYCLVQLCVPHSQMWIITVKSLVLLFTRGRYWQASGPRKRDDPNAVEIKDAQRIGREIYKSICVTCLDDIKKLHHQQIQSNLLLYSAITKTEINLDLENQPIWSNTKRQFGDASGKFTSYSPLVETKIGGKIGLTQGLLYTFNERFSFNPFPDFTKTFHELVSEQVTAVKDEVVKLKDSVTGVKDAVIEFTRIHKILFSLQKADFDFIREGGLGIANLFATAFTTFEDNYPGLWGWLKGGNPTGLFSYKSPTASYKESIAKIIYDKECDTTVNVSNDVPTPTVNVTNTVPTPTVNVTNSIDFSEMVSKLGTIVNAIDRLAAKPNESWNSDTIQKLMDTLADLSIQAVAVSGEGNVVLSEGCCPDKAAKPDTPDTPEKPPIAPSIIEDLKKEGDCEPVVANALITLLEELINNVDWFEDELFSVPDRLTQWVASTWLIRAIGNSAAVRWALGVLEGSGAAAFFFPSGEEPPVFAVWLAYILVQLVIDLGFEGLKLAIDYIKYDWDTWKALECHEDVTIEIDLIPGLSEKWALEKTGDIAKALGVKKFFQKLLNSSLREQIKPGKTL